MTAPHLNFTPSRLNVGEYGVGVRVRYPLLQGAPISSKNKMLSYLTPREGGPTVTYTHIHRAKIDADGQFSMVAEEWRARHYRRAVMNGAGVYRLGLWAYLGARRSLTFTVPEAGASVEPHRVTMHVERPAPRAMVLRYGWAADNGVTLASTVRGTAGGDGLTLKPEPWRGRGYRRALRGNPGVYQMGLWVYLGTRQKLTFQMPQSGASAQPHTVTVRGFMWRHALVEGTRQERGKWVTRIKSEPVLYCTAEVGEATPAGFTPSRHCWRDIQHRRATMSGAGVYQAGLWARLGTGRRRDLTHYPTKHSKPDWAALAGGINAKHEYECEWLGRRTARWGGQSIYIQSWLEAGRARPLPLNWREWKSSPAQHVLVDRWAVKRGPVYSRLTVETGIWGTVTHAPKALPPVLTVNARGRVGDSVGQFLNGVEKVQALIKLPSNTHRDYMARLDPLTLNRTRSTSPRWRGTATHKLEVRALIPLAMRGEGWTWASKHAWKYPRVRATADSYVREVKRAGGPLAWATNMVRLLRESGNALAMRRDINKRLRSLAVHERGLLAKVLTALRSLRFSTALETFFILVRAAYIEACKLGRDNRPRRAPRSMRAVSRPRPPTAPLAPPAL